ncbi:hypothetical protein CWR43_15565 [Rhizobium sullae]|uniref:Uncharacterized protein n=1 Tax=Rhizobium sullae TaxID=50338 RepID=A0A2N0D9P2_RHISU|nr:hypothetical protein CWR43_15565 [Rhizobium sullae]
MTFPVEAKLTVGQEAASEACDKDGRHCTKPCSASASGADQTSDAQCARPAQQVSEIYLGRIIHDFSCRIAREEELLTESSQCRCPFRELVGIRS